MRIVGASARWVRLRNSPKRSKPPLLNAETEWKTPHQRCRGGFLTVQEEGRGQHQRPGSLADEREHRDAPDEVGDLAQLRDAASGLHPEPVAQARPPPDEEQEEDRRAGHEREPAELHQPEDDDLPERAPVGRRVTEDEPGRRGGRGRGEERVEDRRALAVGSRDRERQEDGPDHRDPEESRRSGRPTGSAASERGACRGGSSPVGGGGCVRSPPESSHRLGRGSALVHRQ